MEASIDSLGVVELRSLLETNLNIKLPASLPFDYPTTTSMAAYIYKHLDTQLQPMRTSQSNANRAQHVADELSLILEAKLGNVVRLDQVRTLHDIALFLRMLFCMAWNMACP